jgi:hypothetical protein
MAGMGVATAQPAEEIKFGLYYVDTEYGGNGKPGWVRVGDIDGDEDQDVVAGGGGALFIYENDGDPDPGTWTRWGAGTDGLAQGNPIGANGAVLFDVNEDGALDVVSAKKLSTFGWWENPDTPLSDTVWQFHTIASVPPNYFMHDVIATDIDGDGVAEEFVKSLNRGYWNSDIVVSWHKRLSGGGWESHDIEPFRNEGTPHGHAGLDAADIDGDLDVDIAYANGWYENSGDVTGTWVWHEISDVYGISNTLIREMSGDTRPDIVMSGGHHGQGVYWYEQPLTNPGSSSWTRHDISVVDGNVKARWFYDANSPALHHPESLGVLDLDNDGDLDVTTADLFFGEGPAEPAWSDEVANIYVYANDGDSLSFTRTTVISGAYAGHLMQDNDLNADGQIDFVSESAGFGAVSYYENMTVAALSATPTATPTPAPASLTKAQQACANEMNKNGQRVNKAQLKENERCLMDFQREKLVAPMTFDACMTADRKGRVLKAKVKTATQEAKKCDPLEVPPLFANTDSATVNAAAVDGALALTRKIFGRSPVLDDDLATKAADKDLAKCQLEMLKRADKLVNSVLKKVIKAEKKALKDETVNSSAALESKLQAVLSSNDRINRTQAALVKGVDRKCAALQAAPDTIFPGGCGEGNPNLNEIEACVIAAARCEACLKINAFDDLNLDCDQADDQNNTNGSCS